MKSKQNEPTVKPAQRYMETPLGPMVLEATDAGLCRAEFVELAIAPDQTADAHPILLAAQQQLERYFAAELQDFDLPLSPEGTSFQQQVWRLLEAIPFGESRSYLDLSHQLNNPGAIRALGAANGKNPIAIIVPCHRVIGSDGSLTGYAGGLHRKEWLLRHEGIFKNSSQDQLSLF